MLERSEFERAVGDAEGRSEFSGTATSASAALEEASFIVLEMGTIRFHASANCHQRLRFTLKPRGTKTAVRRIAIGKKRLPDMRKHERHWGFVERVGALAARDQAAAIEVARGTYAIASHRDHTHLLYDLDAASIENEEHAELCQSLGIVPSASFIVTVFNPDVKYALNEPIIDDGPLAFAPLLPRFLDEEGTEIILIGGGSKR